MPRLLGVDVRDLRGSHDLGWNATGVIRSSIHIDADEIVIRDEMPGAIVDEIMSEVADFAHAVKRRGDGMELAGKLPLPIYAGWRKQWEAGPKQHGVLWRAFLMSKLMDRDYSRFRVKR
jgi:hypothetical protein